jgi:PAS domain S-box-containing protein
MNTTTRLLRDPAESVKLALESGAIIGTWEWEMEQGRFAGDDGCARTFLLDFEAEGGSLPLSEVQARVHPTDWPAIEAVSQRVLAQGGITHVEFRVRQQDGTYRWVQCSGRCAFSTLGRPRRFAGVLLDIDMRKRTEERLRQSEAAAREASDLLQAVIEAVPALIYVKDRDGRIQSANAAVLALLGKSWDEVRHRTDVELLSDAQQAAFIMATDKRLMDTDSQEELEEIAGRDDRGPRIWLSHKRAFRKQNGDVVGLVGTSVEITERKRAEVALVASEAHLRRVLDNLFAFVGILELDGTLMEANRAPVDGAGLVLADVLGRKLWEGHWFSHDPAARERIRDSVERARGGEISRFDIEIRWRGDSRITIDYQIAPLRNAAGEVVLQVASGVDVTARKDAEAQRQLLILELKHRVQNLFTIASGMVTMTARSAASTAEMAQSLTGRLQALARAHGLINPAIVGEAESMEAGLGSLIEAIVAPHVLPGQEQVRITGRRLQLQADAATGMALIFHELATNSAKYGALSVPEGQLRIDWTDAGEDVVLTWSEQDGPAVSCAPERTGFGSRLIRSTVRAQLDGDITYDWAPGGLAVTLRANRTRIEMADRPRVLDPSHG